MEIAEIETFTSIGDVKPYKCRIRYPGEHAFDGPHAWSTEAERTRWIQDFRDDELRAKALFGTVAGLTDNDEWED